ncbi:MAG: ribonuclease III [Desulfobacterales bacterium]|nr:ribonuclease III [Desulfobacterales bacterium]
MIESINLSNLEKKLLYEFKNRELLEEALRHSSFANEQAAVDIRDNERLEFLGDAVLNLAVGYILMKRYPDQKEGELSRMRANLVNEKKLAMIARSLNLGSYVRLGKGEIQTNGQEKKSILANAFEAVIGAVFIDAGFDAALRLIDNHFSALLSTADIDFKSQLQVVLQGTLNLTPTYSVIEEIGPDHDKTFKVRLNVSELQTDGIGKSKKNAEQEAARKALEILVSNNSSD